MNGAELLGRYRKLKSQRSSFDYRWEEMAPFIAPSRIGITTRMYPGDKQTRGVYDSTTMLAAEQMAHFIAGNIINPSQRWFSYRMRNDDGNRVDSIREWLEECRDRTLSSLAASTFYAEGAEALIDYGGFGTGFLLMEERPQPVNYTIQGFRGFYARAEKTGRFVIEEGADGMVDTAFREFELSARVAVDRWPDKAPEDMKNVAKTEPDKPFKFVHGIVPRPKSEQTAGAKGMPWASVWIDMASAAIMHEGGYRIFPAAVPRYHRTPGEIYGRGRGDLAFPDAWSLNTAKMMGFEDWALKLRPPVMVRSDSVIGSLKLVPAGPTTINTRGSSIRDVIMPYETGSRPEVSQIKEEELRRTIREIFYVDIIRQLMEVHKSEMTALEFSRKLEILFRLMGPVYGRLELEFLAQVVEIIFDVQLHARDFPPPPPEIAQFGGDIDIKFKNPMAMAQQAGDAEALAMAMNDLAPLAQFSPQMLDYFDPDKTAEGVMQTRGVPAKWTRSQKEIAALREERAKQDQADLQAERLGTAAEAGGKVAPLVKALSDKAGLLK